MANSATPWWFNPLTTTIPSAALLYWLGGKVGSSLGGQGSYKQQKQYSNIGRLAGGTLGGLLGLLGHNHVTNALTRELRQRGPAFTRKLENARNSSLASIRELDLNEFGQFDRIKKELGTKSAALNTVYGILLKRNR